MCNRRHEDSQPIPKTGYGYKVFLLRKDGELGPAIPQCYKPICYYKNSRAKWIRWNPFARTHIQSYAGSWQQLDLLVRGEDIGFCFCPDYADAQEVLDWISREWSSEVGSDGSFVIRRIRYSGGICAHMEDGMRSFKSGGIRVQMGLCKAFQILPEEEEFQIPPEKEE